VADAAIGVPLDEDVAAVLAAELGRARHPYRAALAARLRPAAPAVQLSPRPSEASVSVIVAFRDAGSHLEQAIESVETQEHRRFELILVDDGSTDTSTAVARAVAAREPERIHYLEHPGHANLGKSSSRNAGLRAARGDYVVFLDADDLLLPGKLAHQAALLDADDGEAIYGRTWCWDEPDAAGLARSPRRCSSPPSSSIPAARLVGRARVAAARTRAPARDADALQPQGQSMDNPASRRR
jgi:hypothetical protein